MALTDTHLKLDGIEGRVHCGTPQRRNRRRWLSVGSQPPGAGRNEGRRRCGVEYGDTPQKADGPLGAPIEFNFDLQKSRPS
jgi:hypothetical protein